jgi:hypothetical protein
MPLQARKREEMWQRERESARHNLIPISVVYMHTRCESYPCLANKHKRKESLCCSESIGRERASERKCERKKKNFFSGFSGQELYARCMVSAWHTCALPPLERKLSSSHGYSQPIDWGTAILADRLRRTERRL